MKKNKARLGFRNRGGYFKEDGSKRRLQKDSILIET